MEPVDLKIQAALQKMDLKSSDDYFYDEKNKNDVEDYNSKNNNINANTNINTNNDPAKKSTEDIFQKIKSITELPAFLPILVGCFTLILLVAFRPEIITKKSAHPLVRPETNYFNILLFSTLAGLVTFGAMQAWTYFVQNKQATRKK